MPTQQNIIGVRELRENLDEYIAKIDKGASFTIVRRSKPVFTINPMNEGGEWEEVVDFTKIKKGGVNIDEILSRL